MKCRNRVLVISILVFSVVSFWAQLRVLVYHADPTRSVVMLSSNRSAAFNDSEQEVTASQARGNKAFQVLPGIHLYLPHLKGKMDSLQHALLVSQNRSGVKLVLGVPTISRPMASYLEDTLNSIFGSLTPEEERQCLVVVFIGEPWIESYVRDTVDSLQTQFPAQIASGVLEIVAPSPLFYPDLNNISLTLNDSRDRVMWRTKQNLDYAYLMLHAHTKGEYYIQLEDDVVTAPNFFKSIMSAIQTRNSGWFTLKFSGLGFIGKLFHTHHLPMLVEFLLMFHTRQPGDWLLDNLLTTQICGKDMKPKECSRNVIKIAIDVKPSLFQHIGYHSSLKGKIQKLKDKSFRMKHGLKPLGLPVKRAQPSGPANPITTGLHTTIQTYEPYHLSRAYSRTGYFWGITPVKDDVIDFIYDPPIRIANYSISSGNVDHIDDKFSPNTTIEALVGGDHLNLDDRLKQGDYIQLGKFDELGTAKGVVPLSVGPVTVFRIHVHQDMRVWVILSKISIVELKA